MGNKDANTTENIQKKNETKKGEEKALYGVIAIGVAVVIFILLTIIQNNIVNKQAQTYVVTATADVPAGLVLTQENMTEFFTVKAVNDADIPAGHYINGYDLIGKVTAQTIQARQIVTPQCFISDNIYNDLPDAVEISLDVSNIGQAVAGTLKAGDLVDISAVIDVSSLLDGADGVGDLPEEGTFSLDDIERFTDTDITAEETIVEAPESDSTDSTDNAEDDNSPYNKNSSQVKALIEAINDLANVSKDRYEVSVTGKYISVKVLGGVHVTGSYTSAGLSATEAAASGAAQPSTVFTVAVPRGMQDFIYLCQTEGNLHIAKVLGDTTEVTVGGVTVSEGDNNQ